jgi:peptide/nickel transport system ATP-binding protein
MILITHNIAVISYMTDQVNVMYAGKIVETGLKKDVILSPIHPYNVALISAVPGKIVKGTKIILKGDTPNLVEPPPGCSFHPRCPVSFNMCGWTAAEVASDLKYLIENKYADMFKAETGISTNANGNVIIKNADMSQVLSLLSLEKEKTRSLAAIDRLSESEQGIELWLWLHQAPEMYQYSNRLVSCFLYAPHDEKSSPQRVNSAD